MHTTEDEREKWLAADSERRLKRKLARILLNIKAVPSGCWEDGRKPHTSGYRVVQYPWTLRRLHTVVWEHFNGPVPEGHEPHHTCGNKACCNPAHIVILTKEEHGRLHSGAGALAANAARRAKPTCKRGHLYEGDNLMWRVDKNGRWSRVCRACLKITRNARDQRSRISEQ